MVENCLEGINMTSLVYFNGGLQNILRTDSGNEEAERCKIKYKRKPWLEIKPETL